MHALTSEYIPWRNRAFVTVAETAAIFGRSTTWVRNRITDQSLEEAELPGGPAVVSVPSVTSLLSAVGSREYRERADQFRGFPRLVVDNG
jgi:hypothetical protein